MSVSERIPGMRPGSTLRNIAVGMRIPNGQLGADSGTGGTRHDRRRLIQ